MNASDFFKIFMLLAIASLHSQMAQAGQAAAGWQDPAAIRASAESYLQATARSQHNGRTEVRLGTLDPRLRLKACRAPLDSFTPPGSRSLGNTTVGVRCSDQGGWSIYISARIDTFGPVLVSRQPLIRGDIVQASDLITVEHNLANLPYGYYTNSDVVAGMVARRSVSASAVLTPQMIQAPKLVRRGDRVVVIAETANLKIRSTGKALSDGKSGDFIQIETVGSRRIVDGIVISQGVVKVTL